MEDNSSVTKEEREDFEKFISGTWDELVVEYSKGMRETEALIGEFGKRIEKYLIQKRLEWAKKSLDNLERERDLFESLNKDNGTAIPYPIGG